MLTELYWITAVPDKKLAIMPRPRAGDWLADELSALRSAGVDVLVSLLVDDEVEELGLENEQALSQDLGMSFISYPIVDRSVPDSPDAFLAFVEKLHSHLAEGRAVAIHCRMGIGRSSLVAGSLLVKSGLSVTEAFECISADRGTDVPDTSNQAFWLQEKVERLRSGEVG